jgi:hypothetical protein
MSAENLKLKGGTQMKRYLAALQEAVGGASGVRVGFLEHATYPATGNQGSLHVAQVAFWNEFGAPGAGVPPRPFFRGMIGEKLGDWGDRFGAHLKAADFDSQTAFDAMGIEIKDNLTSAIATWPGDNAPSTIAKKGFDHGLVEKGVMQRSTDYEVLRRE